MYADVQASLFYDDYLRKSVEKLLFLSSKSSLPFALLSFSSSTPLPSNDSTPSSHSFLSILTKAVSFDDFIREYSSSHSKDHAKFEENLQEKVLKNCEKSGNESEERVNEEPSVESVRILSSLVLSPRQLSEKHNAIFHEGLLDCLPFSLQFI
jgi:hypothetical protein